MADELDADYEIHRTGETDFYITRTDRKSGGSENLVLARKRLNFTLEFLASDFRLSENIKLPKNTENARLIGTIKSSRSKFFCQLGDGKTKVSEGEITINKVEEPLPPRFDIVFGTPTIHLDFEPKKFAKIVNDISKGSQLWINLSDFAFEPLLATDDGPNSLQNFYWVPYCEPFKEIYDGLKQNLEGAFDKSPEVEVTFSARSLPEVEEVSATQSENTPPNASENTTATLVQKAISSLNEQQQMLADVRRAVGLGNFLLFVILVVVVAQFLF
ncbi:hypothetical protein [Ruegeria sp. HKCCA4707]|uniref:hypothetical protein n=1 Tax=Ruegeria sp. HKCCA4707 TaxID=2682984 RepID=UPI001488D8D0|nr:hypothetical protein [Ruegeria sp. HKCCA4707]